MKSKGKAKSKNAKQPIDKELSKDMEMMPDMGKKKMPMKGKKGRK